MTVMKEITVADLRASDIGLHVIVIDERGNAYGGVLVDMWARRWEYGKQPEDRVRTRINVESGKGSTLELSNLPLNFRLQIEDGSALTEEGAA